MHGLLSKRTIKGYAERSHTPEAAMKLRTHRRNVVVWRQSAGPGHGKGAREFIRADAPDRFADPSVSVRCSSPSA